MNIIGVLTGDIVNSSRIKYEYKETLINAIYDLKNDVDNICHIDIEIYRGDSFQILVYDAKCTLLIAILLRAKLKGATDEINCDARISIGIGEIEYINNSIKLSDGEVFRLSGRGLDEIGKKRRLVIFTPWQTINDELAISTAFADEIISKWTKEQSEIIFISLVTNTTQKNISTTIDKTIQNVSKILNTAKEQLIRSYINRFVELIKTHI